MSRQQPSDLLAGGWQKLATAIAGEIKMLKSLLDIPAAGAEAARKDPLLAYLGEDAATIASRLGQLHIAQTALLPDTRVADQQLELIQVSADTATQLDNRERARQKLTGLQLHHFGAFYKYSWRANDWMWGRLDGAGWLVHVLLDPRRLAALRDLDGNATRYTDRLTAQLQRIANRTPDHGADAGPAAGVPPDVAAQLGFLRGWGAGCGSRWPDFGSGCARLSRACGIGRDRRATVASSPGMHGRDAPPCYPRSQRASTSRARQRAAWASSPATSA